MNHLKNVPCSPVSLDEIEAFKDKARRNGETDLCISIENEGLLLNVGKKDIDGVVIKEDDHRYMALRTITYSGTFTNPDGSTGRSNSGPEQVLLVTLEEALCYCIGRPGWKPLGWTPTISDEAAPE